MVVYEEKSFYDIYDLKNICWSGALQRIDEVLEMSEKKQEQFINYIIESLDYGDNISTTQLNDFIWFDCDDYIEELKESEV